MIDLRIDISVNPSFPHIVPGALDRILGRDDAGVVLCLIVDSRFESKLRAFVRD